jgi:hypothetical protein
LKLLLDKGKRVVFTIATWYSKVGDYMLAGAYHGKLKPCDERGNIVNVAGPSTFRYRCYVMVLQLGISLMCLKMKRSKITSQAFSIMQQSCL